MKKTNNKESKKYIDKAIRILLANNIEYTIYDAYKGPIFVEQPVLPDVIRSLVNAGLDVMYARWHNAVLQINAPI